MLDKLREYLSSESKSRMRIGLPQPTIIHELVQIPRHNDKTSNKGQISPMLVLKSFVALLSN